MCENELWCPECGLEEGNVQSQDMANSKRNFAFEMHTWVLNLTNYR